MLLSGYYKTTTWKFNLEAATILEYFLLIKSPDHFDANGYSFNGCVSVFY